eukprot:3008633-Amphidinium_carterae.1
MAAVLNSTAAPPRMVGQAMTSTLRWSGTTVSRTMDGHCAQLSELPLLPQRSNSVATHLHPSPSTISTSQ